jgi:pyruvate dehydrogenase E2 component (dihydrolipoamide acetyltransferase)
VRKRIFEGMMRSKHTAAHFTFVEECDATALKELRARLRPAAEKQGVKLTFLPFFVKACVAALKKHRRSTRLRRVDAGDRPARRYHIGIASSTEAGLIVPVVRDADRKSLLDIAREIARLGEDTKAGKVRPRTSAAPPSRSPRSARRAASSPRRSSTSPRSRSWASTR